VTAYRYRAHAKINLGLEVLGKRPDGFHELRTVYQSIALCDHLDVFPARSGLSFTCSEPALAGEDNLVLRAARALATTHGCKKGARLELHKRVPTQAGLGGGSSDAAVALLGLARLWRLPCDTGSLIPIARTLGSDVPFFLLGGTALGVGRGEEVYPLPDCPAMHLVIVQPSRVRTPTAEAYRSLDTKLTGDEGPHKILPIVQGVVEGGLSEHHLFNRFEEVASRAEDDVAAVRQALLSSGAVRVLLAGSGSAWVGFFPDRAQAQEAHRRMAHRGISGILTSTLNREDYWELTLPGTAKETLP
jgi:4-diphosphocytidyl-2-C-methyl-D-erythritol kinase